MLKKSSFLTIICCIVSSIESFAQEILEPVFDRSDVPEFHVEKVVITQDTTYIYCFYKAEAGSWARVSKDMYLEDANSGAKLPLLKASGLPYAPLKRDFLFNETVQVLLYFPHINTNRFNIIEDEYDKAFNIYGINIYECYTTKYEASDYWRFNKMSEFYRLANNDTKFLEFEEKELSAAQYLFGLRALPASDCYEQLSEKYNELGNYSKAIELGLLQLECDSIFYGVENKEAPLYPYDLTNLSDSYQNIGNYSASIQCLQKSITIWRNIGNVNEYINDVCNLLLTGRDRTDIVKRIEIAQKELANLPYFINTNSLPVAKIQGLIATGYSYIGDNDNAINYCDLALMTIKNTGNINVEEYAYILGHKCRCQGYIGKLSEAIASGETAKQLYDTLGNKTMKYAALLVDLAGLYIWIYDYEKAINLQIKAAKIYEDTEEWVDLAYSYNSISYYYQNIFDFEKAKLYIKKAIKLLDEHDDAEEFILKKAQAMNNPYYNNPNTISLACQQINQGKWVFRETLASIYEKEGNMAEAIRIEKEAGVIIKNLGNEIDYASHHLLSMSEYYLKDKKFDNAIKCAKQSEQILLNLQSSDYVFSKMTLSVIYNSMGDYEKAIHYANESLVLLDDDIYGKISVLSGLAGLHYKNHNMVKAEELFSELLDILKNKICNESAEMTSEQKQRLWDKYQHNFLLYRNVVKESGHTANMFSKLYDCVLFSKNFLLDTDVSKDVTYINPLLITWKDIQRVLSEDDIAIEFLATTQEEREGFTYSALVIDKNCMSPQMIELYNDSDTEIDFQTGGEKIWNPILNKFKKVRNIYFSPDFFFHVCPIEYLIVGDSVLMSEKYNIYRLSSTKELLKKKNKSEQNSAVLYGGLEYNQATYFAQEDATKSTSSMLRSISERGGFEPLYNTMDEVNEINSLLSSKQVSTSLLVGNEGTEESFRKLSNMDVSILHLATHGMYIEPENVSSEKQGNNFDFLESLNNKKNPVKEDITLTHSFLVMSGGNKLIQRDMESNDDDGILTAKEISQANLTGVDLVVLSACESALGDINSGGVYGLQRGFKKAGANTILMSVNKVDDEATRIFMVEFYRNLLSGKSKLQSHKDAQKYLREYDNGKYNDPKYWASFIMLDGLN